MDDVCVKDNFHVLEIGSIVMDLAEQVLNLLVIETRAKVTQNLVLRKLPDNNKWTK